MTTDSYRGRIEDQGIGEAYLPRPNSTPTGTRPLVIRDLEKGMKEKMGEERIDHRFQNFERRYLNTIEQ